MEVDLGEGLGFSQVDRGEGGSPGAVNCQSHVTEAQKGWVIERRDAILGCQKARLSVFLIECGHLSENLGGLFYH